MGDYRRVIIRYSRAFMVKLISEIEQGQLTVPEAMRLYGIKGSDTIQRWMKKLGKNHLLNRIVRVEVMGEANRIKELEKEKHELRKLINRRLKGILPGPGIKVGRDKNKGEEDNISLTGKY
jgi:transposase-like protein